MVMGFVEWQYSTVEAGLCLVESKAGSCQLHMELRGSPAQWGRAPVRYIALFDDEGEWDVLLLFEGDGHARECWQHLKTCAPITSWDSIPFWSERIVDHGTGYGRSGSITMY